MHNFVFHGICDSLKFPCFVMGAEFLKRSDCKSILLLTSEVIVVVSIFSKQCSQVAFTNQFCSKLDENFKHFDYKYPKSISVANDIVLNRTALMQRVFG